MDTEFTTQTLSADESDAATFLVEAREIADKLLNSSKPLPLHEQIHLAAAIAMTVSTGEPEYH